MFPAPPEASKSTALADTLPLKSIPSAVTSSVPPIVEVSSTTAISLTTVASALLPVVDNAIAPLLWSVPRLIVASAPCVVKLDVPVISTAPESVMFPLFAVRSKFKGSVFAPKSRFAPLSDSARVNPVKPVTE